MSKQKMSAEDKKMVNGLFWNSFLLEASYNYERQQALGFSVGMWPAIKRFYKTKEGQAEALKRHMAIFNTTPNMVSVIKMCIRDRVWTCAGVYGRILLLGTGTAFER